MSAIWIGAAHGILKCDYSKFRNKCVLVFDGKLGESPEECLRRAKRLGWVSDVINNRVVHLCPDHSGWKRSTTQKTKKNQN